MPEDSNITLPKVSDKYPWIVRVFLWLGVSCVIVFLSIIILPTSSSSPVYSNCCDSDQTFGIPLEIRKGFKQNVMECDKTAGIFKSLVSVANAQISVNRSQEKMLCTYPPGYWKNDVWKIKVFNTIVDVLILFSTFLLLDYMAWKKNNKKIYLSNVAFLVLMYLLGRILA